MPKRDAREAGLTEATANPCTDFKEVRKTTADTTVRAQQTTTPQATAAQSVLFPKHKTSNLETAFAYCDTCTASCANCDERIICKEHFSATTVGPDCVECGGGLCWSCATLGEHCECFRNVCPKHLRTCDMCNVPTCQECMPVPNKTCIQCEDDWQACEEDEGE